MFTLACVAQAGGVLRATDWPNWRGPAGDGTATGSGFVASWSPDTNVLWRVTLPGPGASTPAVAGDRVVLTCAIDGRNAAICLDRSGTERWRRMLGAERAGKHAKATAANPSPVTDGRRVWVYFKSGELACLDLATGDVAWDTNLQERFGEDTLWWDLGTSPVLTRDSVVVAVMQTGPSYLAAFDKETGRLAWKQARDLPAPEESVQSYTTPLVLAGDSALGEPAEVIVVLGADHVTAHDAADGRELWRAGGLNPQQHRNFRSIASPLAAGKLVVAPYARGESLTAVRRGGAGDVTATHVAWSLTDFGADVPTPAFAGGRIVVCGDAGRVECLDPATGKTLARHDLPRNRHAYSASPVVVDDKLIVTREDGRATVLAWPPPADPAAEWRVIGGGEVGQTTVATPVCVDGRILVRTHDALWCFGAE
jgi:outer membrane protein assembly factor BamB